MIRSVAALLCALVVAGTSGAIEISGPAEITTPGEYRLIADVAEGGITVRTGDVALDGNGHQVLGSSGAETRGLFIDGPVSNVTVRNLSLAGWEVGIEVRDADHVRVERVHAENCTANGIYVEHCREIEVQDCVASGNALPGIAIDASDGCRMSGTTAMGNADVGFYLAGSQNIAIEGCNASENGLNGIYFERTETARVRKCSLEKNGYPGVAAADTGGLEITDTSAFGNRLAAIWLDRTERSVITRNIATGSEAGLVIRNASARPFAGGNLWLTEQGVDGETVVLPTLGVWLHHLPAERVSF